MSLTSKIYSFFIFKKTYDISLQLFLDKLKINLFFFNENKIALYIYNYRYLFAKCKSKSAFEKLHQFEYCSIVFVHFLFI